MFDRFILKTDGPGATAQATVDEDHRLLGEVHESAGLPVIRLWTNSLSIVVPSKDSRSPEFEGAREIMQGQGVEVAVRTSGGTAVMHGPGVLNASVIYRVPKADKISMEAGYQKLMELFDLLVPELAGQAVFAAVPGAYCDGDYNLVVDGLKIAGTAQRIKSAGSNINHRTVLTHMSLLVKLDTLDMERIINRYYQALQSDMRVREGVSTGIDSLHAGGCSAEGLISRFTESYG